MYDKDKFLCPDKKYHTCLMAHNITEPDVQLKLYNDFGYGGVVINVPDENGFTSNDNNINSFADTLDAVEKSGLCFWIYDEAGYPSGRAAGLTLENNPDLCAKGFFMHRRISYTPTIAKFVLPDEAEKIIWAAKYPFEVVGKSETVIDFDKMIPLEFSDTFVECHLDGREIMYVFCVKNAYEGSHSTHNVCSLDANINIMDKAAVRKFIDCAYEPISKGIPDAFSRCKNVFTDEPSLMTSYVREDETWPFALAPYCDELFEKYESMHGDSLLPYLPFIFEGGEKAYPFRIRFYKTVGKLIAEAYSGQLSEWCRNHGGTFSGHYLCEENITQHIRQYGDFIQVLMHTDVPGIDILACMPDIYDYETAKYAQIAARKKNKGLMVELCPFLETDKFKTAPFEYMYAMVGILALSGVRYFNSYFKADFSESYKVISDLPLPKWAKNGYGGKEQNEKFNKYVGRICYLLDGLSNDCDTFIYYAYEDAAAKQKPQHSSGWNSGDCSTQKASMEISKALLDGGFDFYYADENDFTSAIERAINGKYEISGNRIKNVFVPAIDVISKKSLDALLELEKAGVNVFFIDKKPVFSDDGDKLEYAANIISVQQAIDFMYSLGGLFNQKSDSTLLKAKFSTHDGILYMLVNPTFSDISIEYSKKDTAKIYNPATGSITKLEPDSDLTVPAMQAIFVLT